MQHLGCALSIAHLPRLVPYCALKVAVKLPTENRKKRVLTRRFEKQKTKHVQVAAAGEDEEDLRIVDGQQRAAG